VLFTHSFSLPFPLRSDWDGWSSEVCKGLMGRGLSAEANLRYNTSFGRYTLAQVEGGVCFLLVIASVSQRAISPKAEKEWEGTIARKSGRRKNKSET